jgi:hypothetical protein
MINNLDEFEFLIKKLKLHQMFLIFQYIYHGIEENWVELKLFYVRLLIFLKIPFDSLYLAITFTILIILKFPIILCTQ